MAGCKTTRRHLLWKLPRGFRLTTWICSQSFLLIRGGGWVVWAGSILPHEYQKYGGLCFQTFKPILETASCQFLLYCIPLAGNVIFCDQYRTLYGVTEQESTTWLCLSLLFLWSIRGWVACFVQVHSLKLHQGPSLLVFSVLVWITWKHCLSSSALDPFGGSWMGRIFETEAAWCSNLAWFW